MKIASASAIRAAEHQLFTSGAMSSLTLMDRVIARLLLAYRHGSPELSALQPERVIVYAGKGNNAGDAIGLAAQLGAPITLRCVGTPETLSPDTRAQLARVTVPISYRPPEPAPRTLIIDGLLGSGATGPLRDPYRALVSELNTLRSTSPASLCLAIDIPTGLDPSTGAADPCTVRADITAPIGCIKPGMLADGATQYIGRLLPIPLPEVSLPDVHLPGASLPGSTAQYLPQVTDAALLHDWLPRRPQDCYKNRAGRVAIIAGSVGMLGAAQLCAEAALHSGAGLITLYCHPSAYPLLATRVAPEIMVRPVSTYADISEPQAQALLIGPGLGTLAPAEASALHHLADAFSGTVILDADALTLAASNHWQPRPNWILTPHPGEMRRLHPSTSTDRLTTVLTYLQQHDTVLLFKGARSIIADRRQLFYNSTGGPYMANGGQGDTLAGTIAALAAQGLPPWRAAALGAWLCGQAASHAWAQHGYPPAITASQVIHRLPQALACL